MIVTNVATLKSRLSHFLELVKKGSEVVVTSHRHPVGKLVPYEEEDDLHIISPPCSSRILLKIKGVKPLEPIDVVRLLRSDRDNHFQQ